MSDPKVVYHRYVDRQKEGRPIQELRYLKGKWELLSRLEDGSESLGPISHNEAQAWENDLREADVLTPTDDSWMIRQVLRDFTGKNRSIFISDTEDKRKVEFLPEQWEIVGVTQITDFLAVYIQDQYLFRSDSTWIEVSKHLCLDPEWSERSDEYFYLKVFDEKQAAQFLINNDLEFPDDLNHLSPVDFSPSLIQEAEKPKEVKPSREATKTRKKRRGRKSKGSTERTRKELLVATLLKHHNHGGDINSAPIGVSEIAALNIEGLSKPQVSKAFNEDLKVAHDKYKLICRDYETLKMFLDKLEDPFFDPKQKTNREDSLNLRGEEEEDFEDE
jgi:hypothetical protein